MLKLYIIDLGYRGTLTAIAESKEKAIEYFQMQDEYELGMTPEEFEIKAGFVTETYADR